MVAEKKEVMCKKCKSSFLTYGFIGTKNRNHCPYCLYSLHVDSFSSGDRASECMGLMMPIALTFKDESKNKYKNNEKGELMLIHLCKRCSKVSLNRVAADDTNEEIVKVFKKNMPDEFKTILKKNNIYYAVKKDFSEIKRQIYGEDHY